MALHLRIIRTTTMADINDRQPARTALGRFRPDRWVDAQGRPMVILDMLEVERRLKARNTEEDDGV